MNHAELVRGVQRVGDLDGKSQRESDRQRTVGETMFERFAVEQRHHEVVNAVGLADIVDAADVRMIELRDGVRFPFETSAALPVIGDVGGEDLDRDVAIEPAVSRPIDFAHAASAEERVDFVRAESSATRQRHGLWMQRECRRLLPVRQMRLAAKSIDYHSGV